MSNTAFVFALLLTVSTTNCLKDYDYLLLATEWQGSVCLFKACSEDTSADGVFNLHGLWPNANNGKHPFSCSRTKLGLTSFPSDLKSTLKNYWSGLFSSQEDFLNHEWSKHGTCWRSDLGNIASMPAEVRTNVQNARSSSAQNPQHYMRIATTLSSKTYNLYSVLEKGGITPKDNASYQLDNVYSVISDRLGVDNFEIVCQSDEAGRSFLYEFRVCMTHEMKPMNCKSRKTSSCKGYVFYPNRKSSMSLKGKMRRMFK